MLFTDQKIEGQPRREILVKAVLSSVAGLAAATWAAICPEPYLQTSLNRELLTVCAVFMLAMATYLIGLIIRGKVNMGMYNLPVERMAWIMTVIIFGIFAFNSLTGGPGGLQLLGFGLGILVFAGVGIIVQDVKRAELRTREKLLRLECQFAELAEKLQTR